MSTKPPPNCKYYYEDFHRGREVNECRLPKSRDSLHWERGICDSCPVPELLRETNCAHLALEGTIRKRLRLSARMEVFAVCTKHMLQLKEAGVCPQCTAEQAELIGDR